MLETLLPANEHIGDRIFRIVLGAALMSPVFVIGQSVGLVISAVIGGILVATGLVGSCPIYTMLGLSTRPVDSK
ncbi:MAG: DUF2892 domain-containing protein [Myxococcota bacterium]